ncbi:MAG TPA: hypothetical protein VK279_15105 [Solirubrobacteraceae bacterium]|nr:hypothetical protein [Solirubrobacteraceae bacterium]
MPRLCAVPAAVLAILIAPSAADAITWGSSLKRAPDTTLSAPVDTAYWATRLPRGQAAAPRAGQVVRVKLRGSTAEGDTRVLFQILRPVGGGRVQVIATSRAFDLPRDEGIHAFAPEEFRVRKGDRIGLAAIGGGHRVFARARGAASASFTGAGKDGNGDVLSPGGLRGTELLLRVTQR